MNEKILRQPEDDIEWYRNAYAEIKRLHDDEKRKRIELTVILDNIRDRLCLHSTELTPPKTSPERDLLYRIGRRLMECEATGEPLNFQTMRQAIDELLYPALKPERFA